MTTIFRTVRCLPNDHHNPARAGAYSVPANSTVDMDSNVARIAPQFVAVCSSGTTAQRPVASDVDVLALRAGQLFLDTSLSLVLVWTGANWRSVIDGSVQ